MKNKLLSGHCMEKIISPDKIITARRNAGQNQTQAADVVGLRRRQWSDYENGRANICPKVWEHYLLMTGQHPTLIVVEKSA